MLAGTACLAGVLVRSVLGLRRTTRASRPATASLDTDRIGSPIPVEMSTAAALPVPRPAGNRRQAG
ncbi:MAG TPA: hypothetical protein VL551_33475 [Actinospica sp.]|jgi:hypothetical protein|nr:hypothetical protein [Actinospica sp.]